MTRSDTNPMAPETHLARTLESAVRRLDAVRWQIVADRDRSAAHAFVYAVRTTGIYCRPGCASRRPKRENVTFFDTSADARAAGFRACRRCRPDTPDASPDRKAVERACRAIEASDRPIPLRNLAAGSKRSPSHFQRVFKAVTGLTPAQYGVACRGRRFRANLKSAPSVTAAVFDSGFSSTSRAHDHAKDYLGMSPTTYRTGGEGLHIRYASADCSLGTALAAATDRGLCSIELGDSPADARRSLHARFPRAQIEPADDALAGTISTVVAFLDAHGSRCLELPLDIRGTAFQHRVWLALRDIRPGETITYGELAERLGKPGAARAVGSAVSKNPIAVAVPCHRVVRSDGSPGGYHWGAERKVKLLRRESLE